ncbi:hypothetical protein ACVIIV_004203 [Bradyrhizobium sp. USDA 4354]
MQGRRTRVRQPRATLPRYVQGRFEDHENDVVECVMDAAASVEQLAQTGRETWLTDATKSVVLRAFFSKRDNVIELPHIRPNLIRI